MISKADTNLHAFQPRAATGRSTRRLSTRSGQPGSIKLIPGTHGVYGSFGYRSARVAVTHGVSGSGGAGDRHAEYNRSRLIDQSRQFMRDNGIYRGMIDRATAYIVGNGFSLQARTKSKRFNADAEKLWRDFWRRPEVKNILSGRRVERMICREILTCGDTGVLKTDRGLIQLIEAEQIRGRTSKDRDGLLKNDVGQPIAFWISPYSDSGWITPIKSTRYDAADFLFITDPDRPSSTRGVPPCQSTFAMLHRINDVCDSEAIAWQLLARLAISVVREEGDARGYMESRADPDKSASQTEGDLATRLTELDYALIFHGRPGEEIKGIERNIPGKNFSESLVMFMRLLGLPLGLPLEVILLDWTKSNYSQSRAVLEQAYQAFLAWQLLIEDFLHRPLYEWKLNKWVREGLLADRDDRYAHEWIRPTFPWIDQLKEAKAYAAKLDRGFATHAQVCKSLNVEREDVIEIRDREVRDAIKLAQSITADTGQPVPWQIFAGLEVPKGVPINAPAKSEEE